MVKKTSTYNMADASLYTTGVIRFITFELSDTSQLMIRRCHRTGLKQVRISVGKRKLSLSTKQWATLKELTTSIDLCLTMV